MRGSDTLCQHRKNRVEKRKPRRKSESAVLNTSAEGRCIFLGCEEEEATTAAICRENERMRKVSVSGGGRFLGCKS